MRLGKCMQIGLLAAGIIAAQASAQVALPATETTEQEVKQVQSSLQVQNRVSALRQYYNDSDFVSLETQLSPLPPLQQEAVRSQLVDHGSD